MSHPDQFRDPTAVRDVGFDTPPQDASHQDASPNPTSLSKPSANSHGSMATATAG